MVVDEVLHQALHRTSLLSHPTNQLNYHLLDRMEVLLVEVEVELELGPVLELVEVVEVEVEEVVEVEPGFQLHNLGLHLL